jgi:hypothetical protein
MKEIEQDVLLMRKGKMMRIRNGEEKPMDLVVTLSNGGRVGLDGTITMPDGSSRRMMDGDAITLDGEVTTVADVTNTDANIHGETEEM